MILAKLTLYKKTDLKTILGTSDNTKVAITGLTAGTVVATGDYVIQHDGTTTDVQGFTVLPASKPTEG